MQLFGLRRHRYGALSGTAGIVIMLVLLLFRVMGSGGSDRNRSTYDAFEIDVEVEPIERTEHVAGAYYPDGGRQAPATESSAMVPLALAGLGGLVVLGGLGAVAFMLFREEHDDEVAA